MADKTPEIKPDHVNIIPMNIATEMREAFIAYSMSVITSRALPDVRDGLKPVHRRILYGMHDMGIYANSKFVKSAKVVGEVMAKYHPHGDASIYDSMVNMAQTFSYRYPYVWGQGNFGSIDGDNAAAMRYTEAKMMKLTAELLRDLEKETVDFTPTYDATGKEPSVLPTAIPALLLNGTLGIAVGMATNIPPHNLTEVIDATIATIDNPKITNEDLMEYVKGPDFPIGGIIYNKKDIAHAYATGRGPVVVRGETEIVEQKNGSFQIVITSIPFRANKTSMIEKIAELVTEKKLTEVKAMRDESTRDMRMVLDLKAGVNPQKVLNYLFKHTELESNFNFNMVALVDGTPQTLALKDFLTNFISHRQVVVRRRTEFDLRKAEARAHILEGLKIALDHIDEVIKLIRASRDTTDAKEGLMKKFKLSEIQALAILDMKLQKLAGLERKKVEDELKEVLGVISDLKALLASVAKMMKIIRTELVDIKEKYGDERRTKVVAKAVGNISDEDLIADTNAALVYTAGGYIKRTDPTEYKSQKRGGVGVVDLDTKEEDVVTHLLTASTHSDLLFFTDLGKVYQIKMYDIMEGRRATKGKSIMNYLSLADNEKVTSILPVPKGADSQGKSIFFVTKQGTIKKVPADSFSTVRRSGLIAIGLNGGDTLLGTVMTQKGDTVCLITSDGQSIRFAESDVRDMGRTAAGVRGINLDKSDAVVGLGVVNDSMKNPTLMVMSDHGYGKRTAIDEYKVQGRGGSGIKTANVTDKTGPIVGAKIVTDDNTELIAISKKSQVIRTEIESIPVLSRATQGVRVMKLREGDSLASLTLL
ncbi:MAG: gyrase subunit gyrase subunit protein [Patescibacteria group bacterium]|nr:gyrase subunit gyrase subunit protein [Patescibacteria group bacterium]